MIAFETLLGKIRGRKATIGVIGLGYVGLPLVKTFVDAGYEVIGFDVDSSKISRLLAKQSYIGHLSDEWLAEVLSKGRFFPTEKMEQLRQADAILICVPTPLTKSRDPDLSYVEATAKTIAKHLRAGQLVILESTTYPGTTRDVMYPVLAESGLEIGKDIFVAYSPEREDPGNIDFSTSRIPKVVGGMESHSLQLANELYSAAVVKTIPVSSCEVAEACKLLENIYRCVNIALVNELKVLFDRMGIDIWEVISAAKTKPFGFQPFYPGPGLGGHCIPIDPFYLSWLARSYELPTRFIELAGETNSQMPHYVVSKVTEALNSKAKAVRGSKISILGVAYKRDVDDPRESPAFKVMELLLELGAEITYSDPHIPTLPSMRHYKTPSLESSKLTVDYLATRDCVVITTDHSAYDYDFIVAHSPLVVDTRNATSAVQRNREKIIRA